MYWVEPLLVGCRFYTGRSKALYEVLVTGSVQRDCPGDRVTWPLAS